MNYWRTHLPQGSCTCFDIHPDMLPVDMINVSPGLYAVLSWIGVVPKFTRARLQNWWAEVCKELYICIWVVSKLCSCPKKYQPGLRYELGTRLQTVHHVYQLTNRSHFGIIPESSLVAFTLIHRPTPHCFPDKPMSILSPLREWSPSFPVAIRYCVYKTLHCFHWVCACCNVRSLSSDVRWISISSCDSRIALWLLIRLLFQLTQYKNCNEIPGELVEVGYDWCL